MEKERQILYITYDGLTDPLGQSQILPYLKGLSRYGYRFTILSFEKPEKYRKERAIIEKLTGESGITWVPLTFTSKPPLLSKMYDALRMKRKAVELQKKTGFDMVHCRSYIAADVGLHLKKKFGVRFFFDMRGFWADEKKDGSWNVSNPVYKRIYSYYKKKEAEYLNHADFIISLTTAGKDEMMTWPTFNAAVPLAVIPCCADMDHFSLTSPEQKKASREKLGLPGDALVISYLGSVGTWYMLNEMLLLFKEIRQHYSNAIFLFVTHTPPQVIEDRMKVYELPGSACKIIAASRAEVPSLVKASDINISFIRPVYSKISSSPTKMGEVLSMGIPMISNSGVGDVAAILERMKAGFVIDDFKKTDLEKAVQAIPELRAKDPAAIRASAAEIFSLEKGIQSYLSSYRKTIS